MKNKTLFCSLFILVFSVLLLASGAGGCGSTGVSSVAASLEGVYNCLDACSGACIYEDGFEIILGERDDDNPDRTELFAEGAISTTVNNFDLAGAPGGVVGSGAFGFSTEFSAGDVIECTGDSIEGDQVVIDCIVFEVVDGSTIETVCQRVTYEKL